MYLDGGLANQKYFTKVTANRKKRTNQNKIKKKKRYKLYKEIAIDNKISPLREANLSPTQGLIIFLLDAVITNI